MVMDSGQWGALESSHFLRVIQKIKKEKEKEKWSFHKKHSYHT